MQQTSDISGVVLALADDGGCGGGGGGDGPRIGDLPPPGQAGIALLNGEQEGQFGGTLGVGIDAFSELCELGYFGHAGLGLLTDLVRQEVHRFPVLEPGAGWTREAVLETVQSFFAAKGKAVTAAVLAQANDIESMGRILRRSIRNYLISEARKTPLGAVRRKIEDLLAAGSEFAWVPPGQPGAERWHLAGSATTPWAGDLRLLVEATRQSRR